MQYRLTSASNKRRPFCDHELLCAGNGVVSKREIVSSHRATMAHATVYSANIESFFCRFYFNGCVLFLVVCLGIWLWCPLRLVYGLFVSL